MRLRTCIGTSDQEAQHVAMRSSVEPLHLVVFGLTAAPSRRTVHRSLRRRTPPERQGTRATSPAEQGSGTKAADRSGGRTRSYASPHLRDRGTATRTESLPASRNPPGTRDANARRDPHPGRRLSWRGPAVCGSGGEKRQWPRLARLSRSWMRRLRPSPAGARPGPSRLGGESSAARKGLGGPYGASFTGEGTRGLTFERRWTRPGVHPYDEITWEYRTAGISSETGKTVFEQKDVEVPVFWSQLATNVVVSKYFRGHVGTPEREHSVKQLIDRVVNTIAAWADTQRYFATDEDLAAFQAELTHLLVHQKMASTRPVWFNVGIEAKPQCSACFINSVQDNMSSIMDLAKTEAMLFKYGSGAGVNLSPIRSSKAKMSGGGIASGPVSFMRGYDAFAGVIKSGGKTRRAAKMVILDVDHPGRHRLHRQQGERGEEGLGPHRAGLRPLLHRRGLRQRLLPERQPQRPRHRRLHEGRRARRRLADPRGHRRPAGRHVQGPRRSSARWPTPPTSAATRASSTTPPSTTGTRAPNTDRIYATNPCSEYMFLNDTACNLASLNLMKFVKEDGEFDVDAFRFAATADDHGAGDPGRQRQLSDAQDRGEHPPLPAARPRLRQPRRAAHEPRPGLRLRRGPHLRRRHHRAHERRGLPPERRHRPRPRRPVRGLRHEPRARSCGSSPSTATRPTSIAAGRRARGDARQRPRALRRGPRARHRRTATATPRSPCSPPPAPSRS